MPDAWYVGFGRMLRQILCLHRLKASDERGIWIVCDHCGYEFHNWQAEADHWHDIAKHWQHKYAELQQVALAPVSDSDEGTK